LGHEDGAADESFRDNQLEYPQYTRPRSYRGLNVPDVLLSGHHAEIEAWRRTQSEERTRHRRPDLLKDLAAAAFVSCRSSFPRAGSWTAAVPGAPAKVV